MYMRNKCRRCDKAENSTNSRPKQKTYIKDIRVHRNGYFRAYSQTFDTDIQFSDMRRPTAD